jgi:hypothetical protein
MFQIVYISTASEPFGREELVKLLRQSVRRNMEAGITGLLLYKDSCFMQALEGEQRAVVWLFLKISRDPRHHHVIPLIQEPIEQRYFPNSSMVFRDLNAAEFRNLPGYSEFLNTPLDAELYAQDIPKSKRLLLLFKQDVHRNRIGPGVDTNRD